jgi:CRISPR type III-A/MTUBE-associated protein Csm2
MLERNRRFIMLPISEKLLETDPKAIAKILAGGNDRNSSVTINQVRKYYDDFLLLQKKSSYISSDEDFKARILPLVKFSKAKLAYGASRENANLSPEYVKRLNEKIDLIETKECLDNFILFYQALIGYLKFEMKFSSTSTQKTAITKHFKISVINRRGGDKWISKSLRAK